MNQNIWGPHYWFFLHTISLNYPVKPTQKDKENYKIFFHSLQHVLPCSVCRKHLRRNLKEYPIRLNSKRELVEWLIDLHNEVNALTGKGRMSYNQVIDLYEKRLNMKIDLEKDINKELNILSKIIIIVIIAILIFLFWHNIYYN